MPHLSVGRAALSVAGAVVLAALVATPAAAVGRPGPPPAAVPTHAAAAPKASPEAPAPATAPSPAAAPAAVPASPKPAPTKAATTPPKAATTRSTPAVAVAPAPAPAPAPAKPLPIQAAPPAQAQHAPLRAPVFGPVVPVAHARVVPLGPPSPLTRPLPSAAARRFIGPVVPAQQSQPAQPRPVAITGSTTGAAIGRPPDEIGIVPGHGVVPVVQTIVQRSVQNPAVPLTLAAVVVLFLLVQHRIDRKDPKLMGVPWQPDLTFGSTIRAT